MNIAWHFTSSTLRDGSPIPAVGQTLIFPGKIKICEAGYHWSRRPSQALRYAPGPMLHKVSYGGDVIEKDDKGVSSERTILASIDATHLMRRFAADQALSVAHLWDMPQIVREYLTTLDESKRNAAWDAARSAAWSAARNARNAWDAWDAWDASWSARSAAWNAAWDAARDAAWDAGVEFDRRVYEAFQTEAAE